MVTDDSDDLVRGRITVIFKEGVDTETIEKLLEGFEHEPKFPAVKPGSILDVKTGLSIHH